MKARSCRDALCPREPDRKLCKGGKERDREKEGGRERGESHTDRAREGGHAEMRSARGSQLESCVDALAREAPGTGFVV